MSKELSLVLVDEEIALQTGPDLAQLFIDGDVVPLDLDDLGKMAEWLAVAWENVAGEEYKPVIITERGYVAQDSIDMSSDPGPGIEPYGREQALERDCE